MLAAVAAVVVLAAAIVVPLVMLDGEDEPGPSAGGDPAGSAGPSDLSAVEAYDDLPTTHVEEPVDYEQVPPVGGAHDAEWLDCGVYDEPVPDENAVHDLEHGTVWITHAPDLPAEDVETLADQLPQNGILSPYDDLPAPVVVTVWGRQLQLTAADDPRLALFVQEFQDGVTAPEPMASCAGGTASADGGGPSA
ncbi:DUF3105 domain-containing protein [Nocardioides litoris]|uniref:DUF3105 domain-containing protein n=1 Tax=Nocardioides litoris TaxID=1926648 RepID=UPI00147774CB|nr:DUF3105 domain-containing protein [Nocardioides litoris]